MQHSKIRSRLKAQLSRFTSELSVGLSKPCETSSARCCSASHTPLSPHRFQRRTYCPMRWSRSPTESALPPFQTEPTNDYRVVTENFVRSENTQVPIIREIMVATTMSSLFVALFALVASSFRTRAALQVEILALRHQLAVFQKNAPRRLRLHRCTRGTFAFRPKRNVGCNTRFSGH
jgi:hypothetical protein